MKEKKSKLIKVKYHDKDLAGLQMDKKGVWVDLRAA